MREVRFTLPRLVRFRLRYGHWSEVAILVALVVVGLLLWSDEVWHGEAVSYVSMCTPEKVTIYKERPFPVDLLLSRYIALTWTQLDSIVAEQVLVPLRGVRSRSVFVLRDGRRHAMWGTNPYVCEMLLQAQRHQVVVVGFSVWDSFCDKGTGGRGSVVDTTGR